MTKKIDDPKRWIKRNEMFEVNAKTGQVRFIDDQRILKNLRYYPERDEIREYRDLRDDDIDNYLSPIPEIGNKVDDDIDTSDLKALINEEWFDLVGYDQYKDRYQISSKGRLRNVVTDRIIAPSKRCWPVWKKKGNGYIGYRFCKNNESITVAAHRLVALACIYNDDPENRSIVHHCNLDPSDNDRSNLMWVNPDEHYKLHHYKAVEQYDLEGNLMAKYDSLVKASDITGISINEISKCVLDRLDNAGGSKWKLSDHI